MNHQVFLPRTAAEIADFDGKMRKNLARSILELGDTIRLTPEFGDFNWVGLAESIAAHRQAPGVFARYFETVYALTGGRVDEAVLLLGEMAAMSGIPPRFEVKALSIASLGAEAAHVVRLLNAGEAAPIFVAREPRCWDDFESRVDRALALVDAACPALAAEIRALVVQVIGAEPRDPAHDFGSVSSLPLWGAVTINLSAHRTALDLAEALVHEAAHLLLFGLAQDQPLVANPDADRFASPLRPDARPMDGVFHAAFVLARLSYFYSALAARPREALSADDLATVRERLPGLAARFDDGAQVIAASGRLSGLGKAIFEFDPGLHAPCRSLTTPCSSGRRSCRWRGWRRR